MWKNNIINFAKKFNHPAWGFSHFNRVYELCKDISKYYIDVDMDSIFAAAYLHDIGAFETYKKNDIDHTDSSIEAVESILKDADFPEEKIKLVQEIIKGHMFYAEPSTTIESIIFHDADTLDFMGMIGITRILSIVGLDNWTPDLKSAINLLQKFSDELIFKLKTEKAKELGKKRKSEMELYLKLLSNETSDMNSI